MAQSQKDTIETRLDSDDAQLRYMAAREAGMMAESTEVSVYR